MTKEQVKNWIQKEIDKNPEFAVEYKKQRLSNLRAELKLQERAFDRKGYKSYRLPSYAMEIEDMRKEIEEVEKISDKDLLTQSFIEEYSAALYIEEQIEFLKSLTDDDHYIDGVFGNTEYMYVRCKEDFEKYNNPDDIEKYQKMCEIYQNGLNLRDVYIKQGKRSHQRLLEKDEESLKEYEDIDKKGVEIIQNLIDREVEEKKKSCKNLAKISVVDAFDEMGSHPEPKQTEKIEEIIELHDPSVVESAIKKMQEYPTENMLALAKNISEAPVQSRKELKIRKTVDVLSMVSGGVLTALGIVAAVQGEVTMLSASILGLLNIGLGSTGMLKHKAKTDNLDEKDLLVSKCINDLLNEVVMEETFNKGFER
jgi:hypothetical protein